VLLDRAPALVNDACTMVAPSRSIALSLVAGAPSADEHDARAPASRAAARRHAALPALTVHAPPSSDEGGSCDTVPPANLEGSDGLEGSSFR
jgi:hypothetical protein